MVGLPERREGEIYMMVSVGWMTREGLGGFVWGILRMNSGRLLALKRTNRSKDLEHRVK